MGLFAVDDGAGVLELNTKVTAVGVDADKTRAGSECGRLCQWRCGAIAVSHVLHNLEYAAEDARANTFRVLNLLRRAGWKGADRAVQCNWAVDRSSPEDCAGHFVVCHCVPCDL